MSYRVAIRAEHMVQAACAAIFAFLLPGLLAAVVIALPDSRAFHWLELLRAALLPLAAIVGMFSVLLMIDAHLAVVTVSVSFACVVISLISVWRRRWSWLTLVVASAALMVHFGFLMYPHPSNDPWFRALGFWPCVLQQP